jgi:hypothetical protein
MPGSAVRSMCRRVLQVETAPRRWLRLLTALRALKPAEAVLAFGCRHGLAAGYWEQSRRAGPLATAEAVELFFRLVPRQPVRR